MVLALAVILDALRTLLPGAVGTAIDAILPNSGSMPIDACFTAEQNAANPKNLEKPGKNSGTFLTKVTSIRYAAKRRDNVPCFPQTRYSPFIPSFLFFWRSHSFFRGC